MNEDSNRFPKSVPTFTDLAPDRWNRRSEVLIGAFRQSLLGALLDAHAGELPADLLMGALNEAEALASLTPFPELFLPALAEEKVRAASNWQVRQRVIRGRPLALAA